MTTAEFEFWQRVMRRVAMLSPEIAAAVLRAYALVRVGLDDAELARFIGSGSIDRIFTEAATFAFLEAAFLPVRERIRAGIGQSIAYFARDIPKPPAGPGSITVGFDILNPRVVDGIRTLETRVVTTLENDVRETMRAFVENGLRDGLGPRQIATGIRDVVGLAPNQLQAVENFRRMLLNGDRTALTRELRDKRFDATLQRLLGKDAEGLTPAQVEKMASAYRRKFIAFNAETNARTAALDATKLGQRLAIDDAMGKGIYDRVRMRKTWVGVMDSRERPAHVAMEGETVGIDDSFSNGESIPGDDDYNCRCIPRYWQVPLPKAA